MATKSLAKSWTRTVLVSVVVLSSVVSFCAMGLGVTAAQPDSTWEPMQSTSGPVPTCTVEMTTSTSWHDVYMLEGVPSYGWYHGCGPTAVGMVVGYWDAHGFDDLVTGDASVQNEYVNDMIASSGHIADYAYPIDNYWTGLLPDKSTLGGAHESDCVADFMHTSWSSDGNMWGWSWSDMVDDGFSDYVKLKNPSYSVSTTRLVGSSVTWERYVHEINSGHPVVFLVDSDGDGYTDHFVTGIGYAMQGNMKFYACYDTWNPNDSWYVFDKMGKGNYFGIYDATCFEITQMEAYCAAKTYADGPTEVHWTETAADQCSLSIALDNNGFKSAVVEIFDTTSGSSVKAFHQTVIMRSFGAYQFGWAFTDPFVLEPYHTYEVEIGSLDGPVGSYLVAYPTLA